VNSRFCFASTFHQAQRGKPSLPLPGSAPETEIPDNAARGVGRARYSSGATETRSAEKQVNAAWSSNIVALLYSC